MKNKKLIVSVIAGIMAAVMVFGLVVGILPGQADAASSSELKNQLDQLQAQKDAISQQLAELEKQQSGNRDDIQSIIDQKAVIDQQVALLYAEITNVNDQIATYSLMISDKQKELNRLQEHLDKLNLKNKERIRAMEEEGELSYWSVVFQANDFSDLLDRVNMVQEIAAADKRRLEEMGKVATEVAQTQKELETEKAALEQTKAALEVAQQELDAKNAEADAILDELVKTSESLDDLHQSFEDEEEYFLNELLKTEQEYNDKLQEEEASRQASIQASIDESIAESRYQAAIEESRRQEALEESRRQEANKKPTKPSGGSSSSSSGNTDAEGIRWITPCAYSYVSSPFGYRVHPVTGKYTMHNGVDLPAPKGTPFYATRSGYVTTATYHYTAGNYVSINHQDGYSSVYMHMTHYVVSKGEYVKAGQLIGYVGSTGRSTGNHLHFGISKNGTYVNPMKYIG